MFDAVLSRAGGLIVVPKRLLYTQVAKSCTTTTSHAHASTEDGHPLPTEDAPLSIVTDGVEGGQSPGVRKTAIVYLVNLCKVIYLKLRCKRIAQRSLTLTTPINRRGQVGTCGTTTTRNSNCINTIHKSVGHECVKQVHSIQAVVVARSLLTCDFYSIAIE